MLGQLGSGSEVLVPQWKAEQQPLKDGGSAEGQAGTVETKHGQGTTGPGSLTWSVLQNQKKKLTVCLGYSADVEGTGLLVQCSGCGVLCVIAGLRMMAPPCCFFGFPGTPGR